MEGLHIISVYSIILIIAVFQSTCSDTASVCGVQDKEELPDFHAAAPWAAALFHVEGDIFQNNLKPQYLSTAIFISRNLAITSGSQILANQQSSINSKLQLFYGHQVAAKKMFIQVRKVELLTIPDEPKSLQHSDHLYLLHLDSEFDLTSFSRPLCLSENVFQYKHQYAKEFERKNKVHISGYATKNETLVPKVYFTPDREWRVSTWDTNVVSVVMNEQPLTQEFLPNNFYHGSALTVKLNDRYFLAGVLIQSSESQTIFRSLETYVKMLEAKVIEYSPKLPSTTPISRTTDLDSRFGQEHLIFSTDQQNPNLNSRIPVSTTTASFPSYYDPAILSRYSPTTQKPEAHDNLQVHHQEFQNKNPIPTYSDISTSTTAHTVTASSSAKYVDRNGTVMCPPIESSNVNGTQVSCWTPNSSKRVSCADPLYPGFKAEYSCSRYYKSLFSTSSVTKHCQADGEWSLNRKFECRRDCGIPKTEVVGHIVHGHYTDGAKWPWHALIFLNVGNHNFTYICGATIVSTKIAISAAHCLTDRQGNVRNTELFKVVLAANSNVFERNFVDNETQIFDVQKIAVPSLYNPDSLEADIAMIQLSKPVTISDFVRPACISLSSGSIREQSDLTPGSVGTVVGFGIDETGKPSTALKEASFPVVSYNDCYEVSKIRHSSAQYCAGYTNGTSVCNGDSGSGHFFEAQSESGKRVYLQYYNYRELLVMETATKHRPCVKRSTQFLQKWLHLKTGSLKSFMNLTVISKLL